MKREQPHLGTKCSRERRHSQAMKTSFAIPCATPVCCDFTVSQENSRTCKGVASRIPFDKFICTEYGVSSCSGKQLAQVRSRQHKRQETRASFQPLSLTLAWPA